MTTNPTIDGVPRECRECGSNSLSWFAQNTVPNGIQQNRLNTHDVQCVFVLGCDDCSETLKIISADKIADHFNKPAAQAQGNPVARWVDKFDTEYRLCPVVGNLQIQIREAGRPDRWADVSMTPAHALTQLSPLYAEQPAPVAVDVLNTGFYTTESGGGKYAISIGFRSMADMQAADAQLRDLLKSR